MRKVGLISPVYRAVRKGWEVSVSVTSGNTTYTNIITGNRPTMTLEVMDAVHPLMIKNVLQEEIIHENGLILIDGNAYKTTVAGMNMPESDIIGDLQLDLKNNSHPYNKHFVDCRSESCHVQCEYPKSKLIRMKRNIKQHEMCEYRLGSNKYTAMVTYHINAGVNIMVGNYKFNNLYVQNAMCKIDLITTYLCEACSILLYAIFQSYNIKKEGTIAFKSNCTVEQNYISCNQEPFKLTLQDTSKVCRLSLPSINETKIINFNYIFLGELDPTSSMIAQETTMDSITNIINNQQFLTTFAIEHSQ